MGTLKSVDLEAATSNSKGGQSLSKEEQANTPRGPALPGVLVTFEHITFHVRVRRGRELMLLQDVTAYLAPSLLTAIIGPSGSGKTTLLDLLAKRKTIGRLDPGAHILFDGNPPTTSLLRRSVGYIEQRDTLLPLLSPREMLLYTAELKLPREVLHEEKERRVTQLLARLSLLDCQHTLIGSPLSRGISGGEAKRTNIGLALITAPRVLLIDEPTSGLDSYIAHGVVEAIKDLTVDGITIGATIHSPPPYTFCLFDRVLVLQRAQLVYFGENGDSALTWFTSALPGLRAMRPSEGISDFVIDITTVADKQGGSMAQAFADAYQASQLRQDNERDMQRLLAIAQSAAAGASGRQGLHTSRRRLVCLSLERRSQAPGTVVPGWRGVLVLWRYRSLAAFKRPEHIFPRTLDKLLVIFLQVTLYWGLGNNSDDPASVTPIAAVLFMWLITAAYGSMGVLPSLVLERPVYLRERADGLYTPLTYLCYKIAEELLVAFVVSVPYSLLVFYLIKLQGSFVLFWIVWLAAMAISTVLALLAGALAPSLDVAGAALPTYTSALLYFCGFLIPWPEIPNYWKWFSVINYLRYGWGALMTNQFAGERNIPAYGGQRVLQYYGLEHVSPWAWLGWSWLFFVVFLAATWAALKYIHHQRR